MYIKNRRYSSLNRSRVYRASPTIPPSPEDLTVPIRYGRSPLPSKARPNITKKSNLRFTVFKKPICNPECEGIDIFTFRPIFYVSSDAESSKDTIQTEESAEEGLDRDMFMGKVDEHFICTVCRKVVNTPLECSECENLTCKRCLSFSYKCPLDCPTGNMKKPAKYVRIVYERLIVKCQCSFEGSIKDYYSHQCLLAERFCKNPVCGKILQPSADFTCNNICQRVFEFKNDLNRKTKLELLNEFLELTKQPISYIDDDVASIQREKENITKLNQEMYLKIKHVRTETEARRKQHHDGNWQKDKRRWTCCNCTSISSLGCKYI